MIVGLLAYTAYLCIWAAGCIIYLIWFCDKIESGFIKSALDTFFNTWCLFIPLGFFCLGVWNVS